MPATSTISAIAPTDLRPNSAGASSAERLLELHAHEPVPSLPVERVGASERREREQGRLGASSPSKLTLHRPHQGVTDTLSTKPGPDVELLDLAGEEGAPLPPRDSMDLHRYEPRRRAVNPRHADETDPSLEVAQLTTNVLLGERPGLSR